MYSNREQVVDTDSYKASHFMQLPPKTDMLFDYYESRGGIYKDTVFFGLQYILQKYFSKPVNHADVDYAKELITSHGEPFPEAGWRRIVDRHNGLMPLKIRAVKEGTVVPVHNPLMTVESTDKELACCRVGPRLS